MPMINEASFLKKPNNVSNPKYLGPNNPVNNKSNYPPQQNTRKPYDSPNKRMNPPMYKQNNSHFSNPNQFQAPMYPPGNRQNQQFSSPSPMQNNNYKNQQMNRPSPQLNNNHPQFSKPTNPQQHQHYKNKLSQNNQFSSKLAVNNKFHVQKPPNNSFSQSPFDNRPYSNTDPYRNQRSRTPQSNTSHFQRPRQYKQSKYI